MGFTYCIDEDSGTWTDDTVVEIMKKSQREYNKRFMNKQNEKIGQKKEDKTTIVYCNSCNRDITTESRVGTICLNCHHIESIIELRKENIKLKDKNEFVSKENDKNKILKLRYEKRFYDLRNEIRKLVNDNQVFDDTV